jgi:hypothetical protein
VAGSISCIWAKRRAKNCLDKAIKATKNDYVLNHNFADGILRCFLGISAGG